MLSGGLVSLRLGSGQLSLPRRAVTEINERLRCVNAANNGTWAGAELMMEDDVKSVKTNANGDGKQQTRKRKASF